VSFYWSEAESLGLAPALTQQLNPWMACMAGTHAPSPRCQALSGAIGAAVTCSAYEQRPSPCREVQVGDARCLQARAHHGLAPLPPLP
jgi:Fe-S-cluster containining protein